MDEFIREYGGSIVNFVIGVLIIAGLGVTIAYICI